MAIDPKNIIDRGDPLEGFNKTFRDSRLPHTLLRDIVNFRLPDQKAQRRRGFSNFIQSIDGDASHRSVGGIMLSKHTPSLVEVAADTHPTHKDLYNRYQTYYRSPLSYGLIRWHDDIQPKVSRDWTLEMLLKVGDREELIENAVKRKMWKAIAGSIDACRLPEDTYGVYVYDQTVLANRVRYINDTSTTKDASNVGDITLAVPALAISYRIVNGNIRINVACGFYNSATYRFDKLVYEGGSYIEGSTFHVAVRHTASTNTLELFINGSLVTTGGASIGSFTYTDGLVWAGENDLLGNRDLDTTEERVKRRDIVLLNEFTSRGSYGSICKSDGLDSAYTTFVEDINTLAIEDRGTPWACSPPRGTGIGEVRFWHEARTATEISSNRSKRIGKIGDIIPNLKMWLPCNEGWAVCWDWTNNGHYATLHHTIPQTVLDSSMVNGRGLLLRDGQHLIKSYNSVTDGQYINDSFSELERVFSNRRTNANAGPSGAFNSKFFNPDQDFTIQVQLRTPKEFQHQLNEYIAGNTSVDAPGSSVTPSVPYVYRLQDGSSTPRDLADSNGANQGTQYLKPFMETIWSIEGTRTPEFGTERDNLSLSTRVLLSRGLFHAVSDPGDPNFGKAKLIFEFFGAANNGAGSAEVPRYYRLESTSYLDPDTVYTLTFRKRTDFGLTSSAGTSSGTDFINPTSAFLEVFINGSALPDSTLALVDTTPVPHGREYDVIVGASYVNNILDKSLRHRPSHPAQLGTIVDHQHFLTPYNDQPGFFVLGFFRLWAAPVAPEQFSQWINSSLVDQGHQPALVYNIEVDGEAGIDLPNKARYNVRFTKGFKSFGNTYSEGNSPGGRPFVQGTWSMEDCLGYTPLPRDFEEWAPTTCRGLAPFKSDESDKYGILAIMDSVVIKDLEADGKFKTGYLPTYGLLSEYGAGGDWRREMVDDRTFFFSKTGFPKVFNGEHFTTLGLRPWNAGRPYIQTSATGGSLGDTGTNRYVGIRIVYISEKSDIIARSPQFVAQIPRGPSTNKLTLNNLAPHPDPRVSGIYIYRTYQQLTYEEALVAPAYLTKEGPLPNKVVREVDITQPDSSLIDSLLDLSITEAPDAEYGAVLGGQLYCNDKRNPSALYRSYPGNPEQFDRIATEVPLDEGVGDRINGIISAFGAIFVFKSASIWRLDPLTPVQTSITKVNDLGLISPLGLVLMTPGDTGGQVIFCWTKQGPYLFDGANWKYVGFATESSLSDPYNFLDPSTISVVPVPGDRELLCFYKSKNGPTTSAKYDGCLVYNYRFDVWYSYEGTVGHKGLTTVLNSPSQKDVVLLGDERGEIQEWGDQDTDWFSSKQTNSVSVYGNGVIRLTAPLAEHNLDRLWVTIKRMSGTNLVQFYSWPLVTAIDLIEAGISLLQLDLQRGALPWDPAPGDIVELGQPPARLTFPWDVLEAPWNDKTITGAYFWIDRDFFLRTGVNWDESSFTSWEARLSSAGKRVLHPFAPPKLGEAMKLDLVSFELNARLDAYAYQAHIKREGVTRQ